MMSERPRFYRQIPGRGDLLDINSLEYHFLPIAGVGSTLSQDSYYARPGGGIGILSEGSLKVISSHGEKNNPRFIVKGKSPEVIDQVKEALEGVNYQEEK